MASPANEIMISLGFEFGQLPEAKREQLLPGLTDAFGYLEAFEFLSDCVDHFMAALFAEYPAMVSANGVYFYDDYHSAQFTPGGLLAYDAADAILQELKADPGDVGGMAECQRVGRNAYQRLKTPVTPADASVVDLVTDILNP